MTKNLLAQWSQIQRKLAGLNDQLSHPHVSTEWVPNTDVYDGPDGLVVKVELAGVACDSFSIHLEQHTLVIEGVRRDPYAGPAPSEAGATVAGYRLRQMEIEYGPFRRVIPLPYPVSASKARARCEGGICEIRLPRARAVEKRTTITIRM
ncbi:MAG: Hsp20/alpha crystallin family protein [bacterium]